MARGTSVTRKLRNSIGKLTQQEIVLLLIAGCAVFAFTIYFSVEAVQNYMVESERMLGRRSQDLENLSRVLRRYVTLQSRMEKLEATYAQSELSFEEVTNQLDQIVRQSIGSANYDLNKGRPPTKIGFDYEKQEFNLKVSALTLEQVVKLLHSLEQGKSPLFLGRVDLVKGSNATFGATLEIFSVRKSTDPTTT